MAKVNFTTPVGRLVQGDLYTPNDKDAENKPLVYKTGPNAGQPRIEYYAALAIPKTRGPDGQVQHWATTEWGAKIWQAGHAFMPNAHALGDNFAWKVKDGDSTKPNKRGKIPAQTEGFPGNWILSLSSGYPPVTYTMVNQPPKSPAAFPQKDGINLGDYVEINANVDGNGAQNQPGVFVNLGMVCLNSYGVRISKGPDVASAGFGASGVTVGSTTPPAGFTPPVQQTPAMPAAPGTVAPPVPTPATPTPPVPPGTAAYTTALPTPPAPGVPNPGMLQAPGVPVVPLPGSVPLPPPVAPPAGPTMTAAAQGNTYAQMIAQGWTDATLRQHGMVV